MSKVKGSSSDSPTSPPSPGMTPSTSPISTPRERKPSRSGSAMIVAALMAMPSMSDSIGVPVLSCRRYTLRPFPAGNRYSAAAACGYRSLTSSLKTFCAFPPRIFRFAFSSRNGRSQITPGRSMSQCG